MPDVANSNREYYYDAFISYRHTEPDMEAALKLHRSLEGFRVPKSIANQTGIKKINRLFRDREELPTSNNLSEDIKKAGIALGNQKKAEENSVIAQKNEQEAERQKNRPDGKNLAAVSKDGTAIVWRVFPDSQEMIDYTKKLMSSY